MSAPEVSSRRSCIPIQVRSVAASRVEPPGQRPALSGCAGESVTQLIAAPADNCFVRTATAVAAALRGLAATLTSEVKSEGTILPEIRRDDQESVLTWTLALAAAELGAPTAQWGAGDVGHVHELRVDSSK
eukprot:7141580-Prymnesium_polylepis.2